MFQSAGGPIREITARRYERPFRLVRWFMVISLVAIGAISVVTASALSDLMTQRLLERDMAVSTDIVNAVVRVENATSYFASGAQAEETAFTDEPDMEEFFEHVATLPDVIRANVYGMDRTILWSSDPAMIGERFDDNEELEAAFNNDVHAELSFAQPGEKEEHASFPPGTKQFVENYLRILSEDGSRVVGAIEVYKTPAPLLDSIASARMIIWTGATVAGLVLFSALSLVVRIASKILEGQEARLIEAERMAVVGEMASAVAHGLRNPLAAIRSCAELALEDDLPADTRRSISDIVSQSDRLEGWIRSFLLKARNDPDEPHLYRLDDVIRESLESFRPQMRARGIDDRFVDHGNSPLIAVPPSELGQVLNSILSNSIEAIERDGVIRIERKPNGFGSVDVTVHDSGPGIPDDKLDRLFEPFETGKSSGVGVGLSLARRMIERIGGALTVSNAEGGGAVARISLPAFEEKL